MSEGCKKYLKELRAQLPCSPKVRRRLLDQFESYRSNTQDSGSNCTYEQMVTDFGPPEEMARELMRDVTAEEHSAFRLCVLMNKVIVMVLFVALIIGTLFIWVIKDKPISSSGTTYIISESLPDFSETEVTP